MRSRSRRSGTWRGWSWGRGARRCSSPCSRRGGPARAVAVPLGRRGTHLPLPRAHPAGREPHRDRADLVAVGRDVALVYSLRGAHLSAARAPRRVLPVVALHARGTWSPEPAVRVFDSTSSSTRPTTAPSSRATRWAASGCRPSSSSRTAAHRACSRVSQDGGSTFSRQADLGRPPAGGGRLLSLGAGWSSSGRCTTASSRPATRLRDDSDPVDSWSPQPRRLQRRHLPRRRPERGGRRARRHAPRLQGRDRALYYRYFDGSTFGARTHRRPRRLGAAARHHPRRRRARHLLQQPICTARLDLEYQVLMNSSFSTPTCSTPGAPEGLPDPVDYLPTSSPRCPASTGAPRTRRLHDVRLRDAQPGVQFDSGTWDRRQPPRPTAGPRPMATPPPPTNLLRRLRRPTRQYINPIQRPGRSAELDHARLGRERREPGLTKNSVACQDCRVESVMTSFGVPTGSIRAPRRLKRSLQAWSSPYNGTMQIRRVRAAS